MKRIVLMLMVFTMLILCVGCGKSAPDTGPESKVVLVEVIEIDGDTVLVKPGMWLQLFFSGSIEERYPADAGTCT